MRAKVNNAFYDHLGSRWLADSSHAIALLVAEAPVKLDYARSVVGSAPQRILDIGCGAGLVTVPLAADGHEVVGVDRSEPSLAIARHHAAHHGVHAEFRVQDALALDELDATFDVALLLDVLEHVQDPAGAVREAVRVVKPGGSIIFHTFTRNPLAYLVAVLGPRLMTRHCPRHLHVYSQFIRPRELRTAFEASNAAVRNLQGVRPCLDAAFMHTARHRRVDPLFSFKRGGPALAGYLGVAQRAPTATLHQGGTVAPASPF